MRNYLISFVLILIAGCANNWLNLKQSEQLLDNGRPVQRLTTEIPVTTHYGPLGDESIDAYKQAINIINEKVGCTVFKQPIHSFRTGHGVELRCWNRIADPDFLGEMAEPEDETIGLCQNRLYEGTSTIKYSITHIPCYRPFKEVQVRVAVHELLHTLGLGHDRELGTVMYHSTKWAGDDWQEEDIKLLRRLYCNGN